MESKCCGHMDCSGHEFHPILDFYNNHIAVEMELDAEEED
jgi:hypothetical protein